MDEVRKLIDLSRNDVIGLFEQHEDLYQLFYVDICSLNVHIVFFIVMMKRNFVENDDQVRHERGEPTYDILNNRAYMAYFFVNVLLL